MAGRYQGYHRFADKDGEFEVYWESGWFWRPRSPGSPPDGKAVGPFVTSTEAYESATPQSPWCIMLGRATRLYPLTTWGKRSTQIESSVC